MTGESKNQDITGSDQLWVRLCYTAGDWHYPAEHAGDGAAAAAAPRMPGGDEAEARITFSVVGGKVSYEIPISSPEHPAANRALIE
eukprot:325071-Chlamydomonas_euryale.AAC.3